MSYSKLKRIFRSAVLLIAGLFVVFSIIITFGKGENLPSWDDVFRVFGVSDKPAGNFVKIMDVGQGDCIVLGSGGRVAVIDSGPQITAEHLCERLKSFGYKDIDVLLLSHFHDDHYGGITQLSQNFTIKNFILPNVLKTEEETIAAESVIKKVKASGNNVYTANIGLNLELGDFQITVIAYYDDFSRENDRSVAVLAEAQGKKFLFTGDGERDFEQKLIEDNLNLDCDVLKVAHHGADTASTSRFINAASPEFAVISCGKSNAHGHPHNATLTRLENAGVKVIRTDESGEITFYIENGNIRLQTEK